MNEPSEMPTPMTDKIADECWSEREWSLAYSRMADFARQLERDLSTLRKAAEAARVAAESFEKHVARYLWTSDDGVNIRESNPGDYIEDSPALASAWSEIRAALASLRSELEGKTTPAIPETPAPRPD